MMASNKTVKFISIDGHGGSGKSTLAKELAGVLQAEIIHIDDFTGLGATTDWYEKLIISVIDPALRGAKFISYSRASWWEGHKPEAVLNQPVTPIMIIEGVCSSRKELRNYMSFKIFVDTPRDICIQRGLVRDKGMGGRTDDEIIAQWNQWLEWDDQYFAKDDPESAADITISGTDSYTTSINQVASIISKI